MPKAKELSFWELLNGRIQTEDNEFIFSGVSIPDIQRDYAEGRPDKKVEQIRKGLVEKICNAIKGPEDNAVRLNFIYGSIREIDNENRFIPVDGQQRLTTLFLIYWFIFAVSGADNETFNYLKRFSYATRNTSSDFCRILCDKLTKLPEEVLQHNNENEKAAKLDIKTYIEKQRSITGAIRRDPSVSSMLIVLKTIQEQFLGKTVENMVNFASVIKAPSFENGNRKPVSFLWLNIGGSREEDLYIKMNSRGKNLTEFELLKAKLQGCSALSTICQENSEHPVDYIGRFNNEYGDFFYRLYGKNNFDNAMRSFIVSVLTCDRTAYLAQKLKQSDYRTTHRDEESANVVFEQLIESPCKQWEKLINDGNNIDREYLSSLPLYSLKKADFILKTILKHEILFKEIWDDWKPLFEKWDLKNGVVIYSIFEFLNKTEISIEDDAGIEILKKWVRYVKHIICNWSSDGKYNAEDAGGQLAYFSRLINNICDNSSINSWVDLYKKIDQDCSENVVSRNNSLPRSLRELPEEKRKIKLLVSDNRDDWYKLIIDSGDEANPAAEQYFYDGKISFIMDYFKTSDECSLEEFENCFNLSKKLFDRDKTPKTNNIKWEIMQIAAIRCEDNSTEKKAYFHRQTNWKMNTKDCPNADDCSYSYREMLACDDLKKVFEVVRDNNITDYNSLLEFIPIRDYSPEESWKSYFDGDLIIRMIDYNRTNDQNNFSFTIAFRDDSILLLTSEIRTSSPNMEVNTFNLYSLLQNDNKELTFGSGDKICNEEEKPTRYVSVNGQKIGYSNLCRKFVNVDNINEQYTLDEAIEALNH